jgi:hypothetical protein
MSPEAARGAMRIAQRHLGMQLVMHGKVEPQQAPGLRQ